MYVVVYTLGLVCLVAGAVVLVSSQIGGYQRQTRRAVEEMRARGEDPDTVFLGAVAHLQASERGRWRTPVRWVALKYVELTRRRFTGR